jgi:hypothetical protein
MFGLFHYFERLPAELQTEIWTAAVRPAKPGIQIFSFSCDSKKRSPADGTPEAPWNDKYYLMTSKWSFGPKSNHFSTFDEPIASWRRNNPSTYVLDSGLWNTCRQSRYIVRGKLAPIKPLVIWTMPECGSLNVDASASEGLFSQRPSIIVSPSQDLFILQLDDPDMFAWSLFDDIILDEINPTLMQMRNVGWEYRAIWASGLHEAPRIRSLDSLCCYIVYGARFGGLETLWLINYNIKRKQWVPSREELGRPELKVFETDAFRLTEVLVDDTISWVGPPEQMPWGEIIEEGDSYTLDDFLAFVHQLRWLVAHSLPPTSALETGKRTASIKVLAYEDRQ